MRDLGFAINDKDFSDRILYLELARDSLDSDSDSEDSDSQISYKKQKTGDSAKTVNAAFEENSNDSTVVKVKSLYIASAVLASCSPFFYKLFKNGMKESQERNVTLTINASEEEAFMDLLNFMYTNTLSASSAPDLLAVLMASDKFEVSSCVSHCSKLLKKMSMSLESALLYVGIPSSVLVGEVVESLIHKAKLYLRGRYADITKRVVAEQEEAMALPLSAIEVVLDGELKVRSEEDVYEFIMRWGRARYAKRRERRKVLTKLIERFVHIPYLGMSTFKKIQECPDVDRKKVSDLILESLYLNAGYPYGEFHRIPGGAGQRFKRDYDDLPIKVTRFGLCHVVYLNLQTELCGQPLPEEGQFSQVFFLGEQSFKFWVDARRAEDGEESYLGLFLERTEGKNGTCIFDYELEVQRFSLESSNWVDFETVSKFEDCSLSVGNRVGSADLFGVPWRDFVKSEVHHTYLLEGILRLRAKFTIKNSHPIG